MAVQYSDIAKIWNDTRSELRDFNKLRNFLVFAGRFNRYNYQDIALIYAQRPNATMVASMNIWNRIGRTINFAAKEIGCFADNDLDCNYLYDVSDTDGKAVPKQWNLHHPDLQNALTIHLLKKFNQNGSVIEAVNLSVKESIDNHFDEYYNDIVDDLSDNILSNISEDDLIYEVNQMLQTYTQLMTWGRCELGQNDLYSNAVYVDNSLLSRAVEQNDIDTLLSEICKAGSTAIKDLETEIHNVLKEGLTHERRTQLSANGIRNTPTNDGNEESAEGNRLLRTKMGRVDERVSSDSSERNDTERNILSNGGRSEQSGVSGNRPPEQTVRTEQPTPDDNLLGNRCMGEEPSVMGRPYSVRGNDLQEEINNEGITTKAVSEDTALSFTEEELAECFSYCVNSGSGFVAGKTRIYHYFNDQKTTLKEKADFLKNEYGTGGHSFDYKSMRGFVNYNDKGMTISIYAKPNPNFDLDYNWSAVSKELERLINSGKYLTPIPHHFEVKDTLILDDEIYIVHSIDEEKNEVELYSQTNSSGDYKCFTIQEIDMLFAEQHNSMGQIVPSEETTEELYVVIKKQLNDEKYELVAGIFTKEERATFADDSIMSIKCINKDDAQLFLEAAQQDIQHNDKFRNFWLKKLNPEMGQIVPKKEPKSVGQNVPWEVQYNIEDNQMSLFDTIAVEQPVIFPELQVEEKAEEQTEEILAELNESAYNFEKIDTLELNGEKYLSKIEINATPEIWERFKLAGLTPTEISENRIIFETDNKDWNRYIIPDTNGGKWNSIDALNVLSPEEYKTMLEVANKIAPKLEHIEEKPIIVDVPETSKSEETEEIELRATSGEKITYSNYGQQQVNFGGPKARYQNNVTAIKLLKELEFEDRYATAEEQATLAQYVGWGGLPQAFDSENDSWASEYQELKSLLNDSEYENARHSTLSSFYTDSAISQSIYTALKSFGFQGGNILEPSMGIGNFFSTIPPEMSQDSKLYGVELDSISGRIAKKLYPDADIKIKGFEETKFYDNTFDIVIGNVPFGDFSVVDQRYDKYHLKIHDYFFAKSIDLVAPGGIVALVTSKGTLDKKDSTFRRYLAERADLIGAVRLPNTAFKSNAGTEATSDIIFLQKRQMKTVVMPSWVNSVETAEGFLLNQYFIDNPNMILGTMELDKHMLGKYGDDSKVSTCVAPEGQNLSVALQESISRLHARINAEKTALKKETGVVVLPADPSVRNFTHTIIDGDLYFRENEYMTKVENNNSLPRKKALHSLRLDLRQLIDEQVDGCSDERLEELQKQLNQSYDTFVKKYGHLNTTTANATCFRNDDDWNILSSIEMVNPETKEVTKSDIFSVRTIRNARVVSETETPSEAMMVSLDQIGQVNITYISELCKKSPEEVISALTADGHIFLNPEKYDEKDIYSGYEERSEYLSGHIRQKIEKAQIAEKQYPGKFSKNITELEKIVPEKLDASEISVRIGSPWVDIEDYNKFLEEYAHADMNRFYGHPLTRNRMGEYKIERKSSDRSIAATETFGTARMNSYSIYENLLNQRDIVVRDRHEVDGKVTYVINQKATHLAQEKARQMSEAFPKWLWDNLSRRDRYVEKYNYLYNSLVGREYNGEYQTFPGMSELIELRPHQLTAIARAKLGGNTLLAHCVGAGKSFEMIAATMEKKRLGLISKACVVVPKHLTMQMAQEWARLYPNARILVATPKDFEKNNRQKFIGRCCTGDYDGVIMSFTQFEKITMSYEYKKQFLDDELQNIINSLADVDKQDRASVKTLERQKVNAENRLQKLLESKVKDTALNFEQLGFDYLVVDEAHNYKNCLVVSKMSNVSGVQTTAAQKSEDMLMKCNWLNEKSNYNGLLFATGTPVSNSMVELYSMTRYLRPDLLKSAQFDTFDDWAASFGEVVTQLELKPAGDGFRMKKRFSKFVNIPELMAMYKEFADIRTPDMVKLPVPDLKNGKPEIIVAKPNDFQKAYVKELGKRSEESHNGNVEPTADNMLKVTHEARLLGLDSRCINPDAENNPESKVNLCINNVLEIYNQTMETKGAQVIFCDVAINSDDGKFSVYDYIRDELARRGIPPEQICTAGDAKNDKQRVEMYEELKSGEKRVIIASTSKLGTGANIQTRLAALHHLDIPWRPSDLEQRNGRIIRQGNMYPEISIYNYVTEETFDAYMLNIITTKQKFISQVMTSKDPVRISEDVDEMVLTYSEMQALASGNPLIKEKIELENDVSRLKLLQTEYQKQRYHLQDLAERKLPETIANYKLMIEKSERDIQLHQKYHNNEDFEITIQGTHYDERKDAGKLLTKLITQASIAGESMKIGQYRGFDLSLEKCPNIFNHTTVQAVLSNELKYYADVVLDNDLGNIIRIENTYKTDVLEKQLRLKNELKKAEADLSEACTNLQTPFPQETALKEKLQRLQEVNHELALDQKEDDVFIEENASEKATEECAEPEPEL